MGIENTMLVTCQSVYWLTMNADIDNTKKHCATFLDYQHTYLHEKIKLHKLLTKPWEIVGAGIFSINNETSLCIVDYYSMFPVMKRADGLSAHALIRAAKIVFTEFGLPRKIVSDTSMNFMAD